MQTTLVIQTQPGPKYLDLLQALVSTGSYSEMQAAFAYVTSSGVRVLNSNLLDSCEKSWLGLKKSWLVGIDWYRSDPTAIESLAAMSNSSCRVFDGERVLRKGGYPHRPFHPKAALLRGPKRAALVVGSGNLSRNGLVGGCEIGFSTVCKVNPRPLPKWAQQFRLWFSTAYNNAEQLPPFLPKYAKAYDALPPDRVRQARNDDDTSASPLSAIVGGRRSLSPEVLLALRKRGSLWANAGNLHNANPGTQVMFTRMTRVFFGLDATDVPRDTPLGLVRIVTPDSQHHNCSLRYSNNGMDVLTLPIPGQNGLPAKYDQEYLLFERTGGPSGPEFKLTVGSTKQVNSWRSKSEKAEMNFNMTSGREWGAF